MEAVFQQLEGVVAVESGYAGGTMENPTYRQVCSGATGHAEVCQIRYDPAKISYDKLLDVFWQTHDPTTLNRQGADVGTQYRSVVFYHDDQQRAQAEKRKRELDAAGIWDAPIVTEISPLLKFYKAEDCHQNYFRVNPQERYCQKRSCVPAVLSERCDWVGAAGVLLFRDEWIGNPAKHPRKRLVLSLAGDFE